MARSIKEVHTINYYPINEGAARRAKEMNSFSDYKEGSATAEYRAMVDKAAAIAEQQKSRVDPMYHEKIDHLLDTYARKLAENMNQGFAIDARVPSVMIAGPANFPVGKKEKQNRARDSNMEEWRYIQGLLDKIRSTGMGGISADDPAAIEKLQKKLDGLERSQLIMKEVNAYYRKHGKLDGCALLSPDQIEKLKASMASSWRSDPRPFESYQLTNNNAEIRRVKARIEQLSKQAQQEFSGWEFDGGRVEMNREDNRLQVFFDGKPDADTRAELKSNGFRWAPSVGAWQRQLTDNAIRAAAALDDPQKRFISVSVWEKNGLVLFQFENYYEGTLEFDGALPKTTKDSTSAHGYGLKSIQQTAQKYGGQMTLHTDNHLFLLRVSIPVPKEYTQRDGG